MGTKEYIPTLQETIDAGKKKQKTFAKRVIKANEDWEERVDEMEEDMDNQRQKKSSDEQLDTDLKSLEDGQQELEQKLKVFEEKETQHIKNVDELERAQKEFGTLQTEMDKVRETNKEKAASNVQLAAALEASQTGLKADQQKLTEQLKVQSADQLRIEKERKQLDSERETHVKNLKKFEEEKKKAN